ncbi:MAG TPA: gephyrin-like molybdotransferase Glp [Hyphomicrobiaceae bacterium]|nr:gephyrin-like molybdotransferase Glp [Hyphomicrobiaceae bacterium]
MAQALLTVAEALARILDGAEPTEPETVPLLEAHGRVLAGDLEAKLTQPPFAASAMDGYAVRAADVEAPPARLKVVGTSAAGRGYRGSVRPGEAVRIFTGAALPDGADAIVIQENTEPAGDGVIVREGAPPKAYVRGRGIDFAAGVTLLEAGRRLDARALTLAAAMGHDVVPVRSKPLVAILATGDELVLPGTPPGPDQIVCSNPFGLAALVSNAGGTPRVLGIARDSKEDIAGKIGEAQGSDIIVTTGGASVGDHDLVVPALASLGMKLDFWKVAMRPGKPLLFGRLGKARVLGVPGNPVSSLVCGRLFLVPLIRRLLGAAVTDEALETATLTHALAANGPRQYYMRAVLERSSRGPPRVTALALQDSSLLAPLAAADCLIVRAPDAPALQAGAEVEILRLDF